VKCRAYYTHGTGRDLTATSIVLDCRSQPTPEQAAALVAEALEDDGLTRHNIRVTGVEVER
jgi:hypothetical protein